MHDTRRAMTPYRLLTILTLVAVLLPMSGCLDTGDNDNIELVVINLIAPSLTPRNDGTGEVHDASISVNKVTPRDSVVKWSDVKVTIKSADGAVLLPLTAVREDTGTYGSAVEVWYSDTAGKRDRIDAGDSILVTGMEASMYEGSYVIMFLGDKQIGDSVMPTDFP